MEMKRLTVSVSLEQLLALEAGTINLEEIQWSVDEAGEAVLREIAVEDAAGRHVPDLGVDVELSR